MTSYLPGHLFVLQFSISDSFPGQKSFCVFDKVVPVPAGKLHFRVRVLFPPPQVRLHSLQPVHGVQDGQGFSLQDLQCKFLHNHRCLLISRCYFEKLCLTRNKLYFVTNLLQNHQVCINKSKGCNTCVTWCMIKVCSFIITMLMNSNENILYILAYKLRNFGRNLNKILLV